jgi:hypothetical protein
MIAASAAKEEQTCNRENASGPEFLHIPSPSNLKSILLRAGPAGSNTLAPRQR